MNIWGSLESLKNNDQAKKSFIVRWQIKTSVTNVMFFRFGTNLKWKRWKIILICILKSDVLLLADIFEKIRNNCLTNYGLCYTYYLSAPASSWDAVLNMTKINLELISDPDMYIFLEISTGMKTYYIRRREYFAWLRNV